MDSLPSTLLFQCNHSGALNFEMDSRFLGNCRLMSCVGRSTRVAYVKMVFRFCLCCPHLHTGLPSNGIPRNFVRGVQQIHLKTEDRENGDLGAVAP